jgi:hypothetical protein
MAPPSSQSTPAPVRSTSLSTPIRLRTVCRRLPRRAASVDLAPVGGHDPTWWRTARVYFLAFLNPAERGQPEPLLTARSATRHASFRLGAARATEMAKLRCSGRYALVSDRPAALDTRRCVCVSSSCCRTLFVRVLCAPTGVNDARGRSTTGRPVECRTNVSSRSRVQAIPHRSFRTMFSRLQSLATSSRFSRHRPSRRCVRAGRGPLVINPRFETVRARMVAFPVAAEMEGVRVGVAASEADPLRVQRFLDVEVRAHASSFRSSPTATIALSTSSAHGITLKREQPDSM